MALLKRRTGFTLIEIVIAVALLAVAGVVVAHLFVHAHVNNKLARDTDQSVFLCGSWIETIKSSPEAWVHGDPSGVYQDIVISGSCSYAIYYDHEWNAVTEGSNREQHAEYVLNIDLFKVPSKTGLWAIEARTMKLSPYPLAQNSQKEILKLSAMANVTGEVEP